MPDPVKDLYERWSATFAERGELPLDEWRAVVEERLDLFAGQQHTFQMAVGRSPDADEAVRRLAEWARPSLGL